MSRKRTCYWPATRTCYWPRESDDEDEEEEEEEEEARPQRICYWPGRPRSRSSSREEEEAPPQTICYWPGRPRSPPSSRDWLLLMALSDENLDLPSPRCSHTNTTELNCCCYDRNWRLQSPSKSGFSTISDKKDEFKVHLDMKAFKEGEIKVKVVGNEVVVEGKHDERQDDFGYISRAMKRKYTLPKDVDVEDVKTELSSDGILTITAPKKKSQTEAGTERVIPIIKTNKPASVDEKDTPGRSTSKDDANSTGLSID